MNDFVVQYKTILYVLVDTVGGSYRGRIQDLWLGGRE